MAECERKDVLQMIAAEPGVGEIRFAGAETCLREADPTGATTTDGLKYTPSKHEKQYFRE